MFELGYHLGSALMQPVFFFRAWWFAGRAALMAAASVTPPGSLDVLQPGFSKNLLGTKLEDKYLCSACRNVLRRPFQAQCGHRYCSFCLSSILRYVGQGGPGGPAGEVAPGLHGGRGSLPMGLGS